MNKIEKVLSDKVRNMKGFVLGFGQIDESLIKEIDKNNNINEFVLLSDANMSSTENSKSKNNKKLSYHKIQKKFRKKNITNIIAFYDDLKSYRRRFVIDSLFLAKENIYVIIKNEDIDVDLVKNRFKRYHQELEITECRNGYVLQIKKTKYRKNKVRDSLYLLMDFIVDIINLIGDLFVL